VVQAKERSYHERHPTDQFLPLIMEVFGCLHKQVDLFLHNCANAIWSLKGLKCLSAVFVFVTFLRQKKFNHIAKATSILHFKSGNHCNFNDFPTSTPVEQISHLHDQLIVGDRFLIWKNMTDLLKVVNF
jgi:hypothetical protein